MFVKTKVRKSSGRFMAYGVWWEPNVDPASMQLDCIRAGGKWLNNSTGEMAGEGNYYHYRKFQEIVWPERIWEKGPYKNYWADKILEGWLEYKYFGLMGCAASGKSDSLGAICLTDWYPFSDCTTTIVSSTELQMLQRRIWGFIEKYHRLAKKRCAWIPGHLIQSKLSILQDARDEEYEGKSHINAIFGVPCKRGNSYVGLDACDKAVNFPSLLLPHEGRMIHSQWRKFAEAGKLRGIRKSKPPHTPTLSSSRSHPSAQSQSA